MVYLKDKRRLWEIDFLRGAAVIMMIIFNYAWSLNYFGILKIDISSFAWTLLAITTASIFILLVGIGLTLSYSRIRNTGVNHIKKYLVRGLKIFGYGLIITVASYLIVGSSFVRFGILHFIGIGIILSVPFLNFRRLNLFLAGIFIGLGILFDSLIISSNWLFWLGLRSSGFYTIDYFPVFPWFGVILFGIFMGNTLFLHGKRRIRLKQEPNIFAKPICFLGRYSLLIYFLHMILILGIIKILL